VSSGDGFEQALQLLYGRTVIIKTLSIGKLSYVM